MSKKTEKEFVNTVWKHFKKHGRVLPWRHTRDPYSIFVSEIMLQQTQVTRVIPKYEAWLQRFPSFKALAAASQKEVLLEWQGLGYNRRGQNLHKSAQVIMRDFNGALPKEKDMLLTLPGIGAYTAGALKAFVWNEPSVFFETNIRTAFISHFFKYKEKVADKDIAPIAERVLDKERAREWYWALMDYGAHLKQNKKNSSVKSIHYKRQSPFKGSNREVRSRILKKILEKEVMEKEALIKEIADKRAVANIQALTHEGFIEEKEGVLFVK